MLSLTTQGQFQYINCIDFESMQNTFAKLFYFLHPCTCTNRLCSLRIQYTQSQGYSYPTGKVLCQEIQATACLFARFKDTMSHINRHLFPIRAVKVSVLISKVSILATRYTAPLYVLSPLFATLRDCLVVSCFSVPFGYTTPMVRAYFG